jgi:hypothetical protein
MRHSLRLLLASMATLSILSASLPRAAAAGPSDACCVLPDNGGGTADHVPNCPTGYVGQMQITQGLPLGSTVQIAAVLKAFAGLTQVPGGALGGMKENWTATMPLQLTGTGIYSSYSHNINLPISSAESHSAPRVAFAPVQSFNTDLYQMQGVVTTDPDFDFLRVTAGSGFGYPSPGHTIFTQVGGGWAVDSFFDIYYRVDFIGSSTGPFAGMSGSTTGTYRFEMCHDAATPTHRSTWGDIKLLYR